MIDSDVFYRFNTRVVNRVKKLDVSMLPRLVILISVISLATGCAGMKLRVQNLAKSETDFITDAHYQESQAQLKELTIKLYRRNPAELSRVPGMTIETRVGQLFGGAGRLVFAELNFVQGTEALNLALDYNFRGDRVFALMTGFNGMLRNSYGYRSETFMLDQMDEQKLYQSARNIEILVWRLKQPPNAGLRPLILTNNLPGEAENLSFERAFGKLIMLQDMMAVIASQKNQRLINVVAHSVSSVAFFPL
jgi:hypothetical protein